MAAATSARPRAKRRPKAPLEYSILYTATLCLLAAGAVMVYSASSASSLLKNGDPAFYLKRYVIFGALGLVAMHLISRGGLRVIRNLTPVILGIGFLLTLAVKIPHVGVSVNGAARWLAAGPIQFQPSELLKVALVLYGAQILTTREKRIQTLGGLCKPLLLVVGAACLLLLKQPDMGTALVICFAMAALLVGAGARRRDLLLILGVLVFLAGVFAIVEPYRRARLLSFVNPWGDSQGAGFQSVQAMIAMGSGGLFGRGLGESVQKIFYLPEAHTDMILAVIGEELGAFGVTMLAGLYALIGYAGFRTAKLAGDRYSKLLALGLTSLILGQAVLNFFAVMGMAPLTGVPLPFVSYGNSNLIVLLGAMGLLLGVAARSGQAAATGDGRRRQLRAIEGGRGERERAARADRGGRDGRTRRAGSRDRRRAAR
jgi:cell division protein FtsW